MISGITPENSSPNFLLKLTLAPSSLRRKARDPRFSPCNESILSQDFYTSAVKLWLICLLSYLCNIIDSIIQIKFMEDTEQVVLVFPGFWLHQKPGDVRLLKALPSGKKKKKKDSRSQENVEAVIISVLMFQYPPPGPPVISYASRNVLHRCQNMLTCLQQKCM